MHGIQNVGVVGAGQMGGGIAQVAAVAGIETLVTDTTEAAIDRCKATHAKLLARAVEKGRMEPAEADAAQSKLQYVVGGAADLVGCDIAIEAVVEDAGVKAKVFTALAEACAETTILATNTSSISITEIAAAAAKAKPGADARVIGMHFFYPVPVMKLVEVINGLATDAGVTKRVMALAEAMGKVALPANDRAGFVSNRVLMPMINEAFYAWMEGVAEPEAIDGIMKLGCNFPMGPLRLADFIGLDTCAHIMDEIGRAHV